MEQGENQGAGRGQPGPALVQEQLAQGVQAGVVGEGAGGQIGHEHHRDDDLIGRKAQEEGGQDDPVQAQQPGEGVQKAGAPAEKTPAPRLHVGQKPQEQSRRGGHDGGPAQHKEGPVQHRADHHLAYLGPPVGGQLQGKGGGLSFQHRGRQQAGRPEGHPHPQQNDGGKQPRGQQPAPRPGAGEEHGDEGDKGGEAAVAGDEIVGQGGDEPLPGAVDDAAARHPGGVAAEAHGHGEGLLAAGAGLLEGVVQHEGHPGQVAEVLQQGEEGEEDGHGGQHH